MESLLRPQIYSHIKSKYQRFVSLQGASETQGQTLYKCICYIQSQENVKDMRLTALANKPVSISTTELKYRTCNLFLTTFCQYSSQIRSVNPACVRRSQNSRNSKSTTQLLRKTCSRSARSGTCVPIFRERNTRRIGGARRPLFPAGAVNYAAEDCILEANTSPLCPGPAKVHCASSSSGR